MSIFLSAPPLWTASAGVSTALSLQHYPKNNEDEDEEEEEDDFYRAWVCISTEHGDIFLSATFVDNISGRFHSPESATLSREQRG